jgi:hypothetical protein
MASKGKGPYVEDLFAPNRKIQVDNLQNVNVKMWVYFSQDQSFLIVP